MLVVSRKVGETLRIGDTVEVTVVRIAGNTVRIGIEAPSETVIQRSEVIERIVGRVNELEQEKGAQNEIA